MPVTYEGKIWFEGHEGPSPGGDNDYNWLFHSDVLNAGMTTWNQWDLKLEHDSDETIDHFDDPWWQAFHDAVDNHPETAYQMVKEKRAVVSGYMGLDMVHGAPAELHPVYALAIETSTDPTDTSWAFFVRNFGNEGMCSSQDHPLDLPTGSYTLRLPWPKGASGVRVTSTTFLTDSDSPASVYQGPFVQHGYIEIAFKLPDHSLVDGEIHLAVGEPPGAQSSQPQKNPPQSTQPGCPLCSPAGRPGAQEAARQQPPLPGAAVGQQLPQDIRRAT